MSSFGPMGNQRPPGLPTPPKGEPIARYTTYLEAQRAVDFLSDNQFPVQNVTIVGSGLRMVERVTGRLTYGRVALAGAASGAWFGLFVGLLLSLFGSSGATSTVLAAVAIGAAFGILFGVISYALTGGRRDFTSTSQIVASEYEVLCMPEQASDAIRLLNQLPGGTGRSSRPAVAGIPNLPPPTGTPSPGPPPNWTSSPQPTAPPADSAETPAPPPSPPVTGPTYGEMIEKRRRQERQAREQAERERDERDQTE